MVKLMAQTTVQQLIERDMFQERLKKSPILDMKSCIRPPGLWLCGHE
jgi:hypothetical protein